MKRKMSIYVVKFIASHFAISLCIPICKHFNSLEYGMDESYNSKLIL